MSFMMKAMLGSKLKDMTGGGGGEAEVPAGDVKETPESKGMSREEFEEYQRQLIEENVPIHYPLILAKTSKEQIVPIHYPLILAKKPQRAKCTNVSLYLNLHPDLG
uniref:Uncharacterized protein n=1 Tax=Hucho hucho TaxID=62062 RepID=A0A4W5LF99_9TELE